MLDVIEIILIAVILYKLFQPKIGQTKHGSRAVIDSCGLIDGRILELSKSGFMPKELIIPEFILHELQLLADGSDPHKRERARYGLDVVHELQDIRQVTVTIDRESVTNKGNTDDKLVELSKKRSAMLYTTDFNLAKIAAIKNIKVLNVNEAAGGLRPIILPGEQRIVKLIQKGSSDNQGVGYAEDGTMLVVENGARYIGKTVKVAVTRMHQTVSGKMIFAEVISDSRRPISKQRPTENPGARLKKFNTSKSTMTKG